MPERGRRGFLKATPGTVLAFDLPLAYDATILAVRVWPAQDYTRITLELDQPMRTSDFTVPDPPRMVIDFEGLELDAGLARSSRQSSRTIRTSPRCASDRTSPASRGQRI